MCKTLSRLRCSILWASTTARAHQSSRNGPSSQWISAIFFGNLGFGIKCELRGASDQSQLYTLHTLLIKCELMRGCCCQLAGCRNGSYVWKGLSRQGALYTIFLNRWIPGWYTIIMVSETIYLLHLASMKINAGSETHDTRHREAPPSKHLQAWRGCASHNPSRMRKKTLACQCTPYLNSLLFQNPRRLPEAATTQNIFLVFFLFLFLNYFLKNNT